MAKDILSIWALLIGVLLLALGNGLQGSLVGIRATAEAFSATTTGLIMSGYSAGLFLSAFVTPRAVGRVGHIRVFAAFAAVVSTVALLIPLWVEPGWWMLLRFAAGMCTAGLYIVCESWLNAASSNQNRGRLLSVYMMVVYGAMGLGNLLLNIDDPSGYVRFMVVSALLSMALVPVALARSGAPSIERPRPVGLAEIYRASPLAFVGTFANGLGQSAFFQMGAVYAIMQGLPLSLIATMMALPPLGVIVSQFPIGILSDRYDRRQLMMVLAFLAAGIAALCIPAASVSYTALIALFTLFGAVALPIYSLAVAHANDHLDKDQMLGASSKLVLIYGTGAIMGPSIAGGLMQAMGTPGFMTYMIFIYGVLGLFAVYRSLQRPAPKPADTGALYGVSPSTTPVMAAVIAEEMGETAAGGGSPSDGRG